jgi:hypothetical protein
MYPKNKKIKNKKIEQIHWYVLCKMAYCSNLHLQWGSITLEHRGDIYKGEGVIIMVIPTSLNYLNKTTELSLGCEVTTDTWRLLRLGFDVWKELEKKKKLERGKAIIDPLFGRYIKPYGKKYVKTPL